VTPEWIDSKLTSLPFSNVTLMTKPDGSFIVVKSTKTQSEVERETTILKKLNHPLVMKSIATRKNHSSALTLEFIPNGSLANHLSESQNADLCPWRNPTRIVKIIVGIVLAMRYIHSQNVIHGDLNSENILLDWKWNIKIANFGHSTSSDCPSADSPQLWSYRNFYYLAPERYENTIRPENDVFSFGLILYELIVGKPAIEKTRSAHEIERILILEDWKPEIPNFVLPQTKDLILGCLMKDYRPRLLFSDVFDRIEEMKFKLMPGVNSSKLVEFVKEIQIWEATNLT
jgi:serine/threonine protein kinase